MRKLSNRNLPNEWSGDLNCVSTRSKQAITNFVNSWIIIFPFISKINLNVVGLNSGTCQPMNLLQNICLR